MLIVKFADSIQTWIIHGQQVLKSARNSHLIRELNVANHPIKGKAFSPNIQVS